MGEIEDELRKLIYEKYGSVKNFAKTANIPYTTVMSILNRGIENANLSNILIISNFLELSIDYLVEKTPINTQQLFAGHSDNVIKNALEKLNQKNTELTVLQNKELINSINKLNTNGQQKVKEYADDLIENPKYRKEEE